MTRDRAQPGPRLADLWGDGPARPAGLGPRAVLEYLATATWKDETWGGAKVLWAVDPAVTGLVLIRGKRLDAPGEVAFEDPPIPELRIDVDRYQGLSGGWKDYPSYTRLRAPGCYLYRPRPALLTLRRATRVEPLIEFPVATYRLRQAPGVPRRSRGAVRSALRGGRRTAEPGTADSAARLR